MKSTKKSMGAKKGKQDGGHGSVPTRVAPRTRRSSTRGTVGSQRRQERDGQKAGDEGRPVETGRARASGTARTR